MGTVEQKIMKDYPPISYQICSSQHGNALFLILIAVALFATLSYAITHSDRGRITISNEQALINAGVSQDCAARVEQAVLRLKTLMGCTDTTISYELADGTNPNANAPEDKHCNVFDTAGAGESPCGSYLVASSTCGESSTSAGAIVSGGSCDGLVYVSNNLGSRLYTTPADSGQAQWNDTTALCILLGEDWRVPTKDELNELYLARHTGILNGTFNESGVAPATAYWSSTASNTSAWGQWFNNGLQFDDGVSNGPPLEDECSVRCVRN